MNDIMQPELHRRRMGRAANAAPDINPSNTNDVVGEYAARRRRAGDARHRGGARRPFRPGRARRRRSAHDILTSASATRSSPARTSSAACCRARKARRWPKASARRRAPARSSRSSPARRCAWRARSSPPCGPASTSRSRASRSASSASSRRGISRSPSRPGRSRRRWPTATRVVFKPADLVPGCAHALVRDHRAGRPAQGRVQPRHGPRLGGRPGDPRTHGRRRDHLHRLGRTRAQGGAGRLAPTACEVPARDGRQEPAGRARRRRPQDRGRMRGQRRLLLDRPALHGVVAPHRHATASTTASSTR